MTFINKIKDLAIKGWYTNKILPSISIAQAIHESASGTSVLGKTYNNLYGIKWTSDFSGKKINLPTKEHDKNNGSYQINADFRWYNSWEESVLDYTAFFTNTPWRTENYKHVVGEKDYKVAAKALQAAGYATDQNYATKIINTVERYNLTQFDVEAFNGSPSNITKVKKIVGGTLSSLAETAIKNYNVTLIGDSLGVGTHPKLTNTFKTFNHDTLGSRQITHVTDSLNGTKVLTTLKNSGNLKDYVIVILGTNRGVTKSEIDNFVSIAGSNRKIIFVDTNSAVNHKSTVASAYKEASERFNNVYYANWSSYSKSSRAVYYGSDNIHMTDEGYSAHASFIKQAVYEVGVGVKPNSIGTGKPADLTEYYGIEDIDFNEDGITSPLGESILYNYSASDLWDIEIDGQIFWTEEIIHVDSDDPEVILAKGIAYLKENAQPNVQYEVDLAELPHEVSIGDTGIMIDHHFNPPVYIQARVTDLITSETDPNGNKAVIGNVVVLYPQDKTEILKIQEDLKDIRKNLVEDYRKGEPVVLEIESTGGTLISSETQLITRAYQGSIEVTERFHNWKWERDSKSQELDAAFNEMLKHTSNSSHLTVYHSDLFEKESVFRVTLYDDDNKVIASAFVSLAADMKVKDIDVHDLKNMYEFQYVEFPSGEKELLLDSYGVYTYNLPSDYSVTYPVLDLELGARGDIRRYITCAVWANNENVSDKIDLIKYVWLERTRNRRDSQVNISDFDIIARGSRTLELTSAIASRKNLIAVQIEDEDGYI